MYSANNSGVGHMSIWPWAMWDWLKGTKTILREQSPVFIFHQVQINSNCRPNLGADLNTGKLTRSRNEPGVCLLPFSTAVHPWQQGSKRPLEKWWITLQDYFSTQSQFSGGESDYCQFWKAGPYFSLAVGFTFQNKRFKWSKGGFQSQVWPPLNKANPKGRLGQQNSHMM